MSGRAHAVIEVLNAKLRASKIDVDVLGSIWLRVSSYLVQAANGGPEDRPEDVHEQLQGCFL